jgi:hypothetical protein
MPTFILRVCSKQAITCGPMIGEGGAGAVRLTFTSFTQALSLETQHRLRPSADTAHLLDTSFSSYICLASVIFVWNLHKATMCPSASPIIDKSSKAADGASASEQPMTAEDLVAAAFQDDRTDLRDRCRLGLSLNAIGHTQMDVMALFVLDSVWDITPHIREYVARKCNKLIAGQPIVPENTSEEDRGVFLSINGCVEIAVFNYGWISRIIEGKHLRNLQLGFR